MAMHLLGVIEAYKQNQIIDWNIFILVQFTITITNSMTHFFNEYGDYEADKFNKKYGAWTGGSKILKNDLLPKRTALVLGVLFLFLSILGGVLTLIYYIFYMENTMLINIFGFFIYGLSVSYVLTFATPIIGCLIQNGFITQPFIPFLNK
jgi:1,4-dihydroxy-2-naphthoate polyprenyltransferase